MPRPLVAVQLDVYSCKRMPAAPCLLSPSLAMTYRTIYARYRRSRTVSVTNGYKLHPGCWPPAVKL